MELKLYNTKSPVNSINKKLENETIFDIRLKDNTDIVNPNIKLFSHDLLSFNYAYISAFSRYYFINSIVNFPKDIYSLNLSCDVLETYKTDILNCYAVIGKQENYNNYYDDNYLSEIKKLCILKKSEKIFNTENKTQILVSIGSVS